MTARFWCFTLNNPTELLDPEEWTNVRYCIYQLEIGEQGTEHFQGYLECNRGCRLAALKKLDGLETAHFEVRRGTQKEAIAYCRKEDSRVEGPWEFGEPSGGQGTRVDLDKLKMDIDKGDSLLEIAQNHFSAFLRYPNSINRYMQMVQKPRRFKPRVAWFVGPPKTGKTFGAHREGSVFNKPHSKWWDGYRGDEDVILLDDFKGWIPFHELLGLLDEYDYQGEVKGGFVRILSPKIIITSNLPPDRIYKDETLPFEALARRIDDWFYFDKLGEEPYHSNSYSEFSKNMYNLNVHLTDNNNQ